MMNRKKKKEIQHTACELKMIKKILFLIIILLAGTHLIYAQYKEKDAKKLKKRKSTLVSSPVCPPIPEEFYQFFETSFIDFSSLREGEKVTTFSFRDSLCSPLTQDLMLTSSYGMRNGRKHYGVDFRVKVGDTVRSIFCGRVRIAKWDDQYGKVLVIRNYNMSETVYAHLDKVFVRVGQEVRVGQLIGFGGNTGRSSAPHLHLELRYKGFPINPIISSRFLMIIPVRTVSK
jgi:murein DD-endopeptidase MepM/ murein hydrolase activator NlpD